MDSSAAARRTPAATEVDPSDRPPERPDGSDDGEVTLIRPRPAGGGDSASTLSRMVPPVDPADTDSGAPPVVGPGRSPVAVSAVLAGRRLNHFRLGDLIGGGGMGAVFKATDERLDRIVAVKVIPFVAEDPELQRRFRNEAQAAAKLDHPRIARVFEVGNDGPWHYIVFEYIEGDNVRDAVTRDGPMSLDDAIAATMQVAEALAHASRRGIVHRDIKPSNVVLMPDGNVKLVDMGLARSDALDRGADDMTATGVTLGTFDYLAPEQARDPRIADVRSDLYSLGCTLFFMLTGAPPYPDGTMLQKLLNHGGAPVPDIRSRRAELPPRLTKIVNRLLAKQSDDRYRDPMALVVDLNRLAVRCSLRRSRSLRIGGGGEELDDRGWLRRRAPAIATVAASMFLAVGINRYLTLPPGGGAIALTETSGDRAEPVVIPAPPAPMVEPAPRPTTRPGDRLDQREPVAEPLIDLAMLGQSSRPDESIDPQGEAFYRSLDADTARSRAMTIPTPWPPEDLEPSGDRPAEFLTPRPSTATDRLTQPPSVVQEIGGATEAGPLAAATAEVATAEAMSVPAMVPPPGGRIVTRPAEPMPQRVLQSYSERFQRFWNDLTGVDPPPREPAIDVTPAEIGNNPSTDLQAAAGPDDGPPVVTEVPQPTSPAGRQPPAGPLPPFSPPEPSGPRITLPPPMPLQAVQVVDRPWLSDPQTVEEAIRTGRKLASELAEAIELADELGLPRVELGVASLTSRPVRLHQDLELVSIHPAGTTIQFDAGPIADQPGRGRDPVDMIDIGGHRFEMTAVHCRWSVPAMHTGGGSMVLVNANPKVSLRGCSLTIQNPAAHRNVYAFRVVTDPKTSVRPGGENLDQTQRLVSPTLFPALPLVSIELDNTIIRGTATMVGMDVAADLQLRYDNGLLALDGRMLQCGGAALPTRPTIGSIRLSLNRVTSLTTEGIVRLEMTRQTPYPVRIDRFANGCVFVVPRGKPHFDIRNLRPEEFAKDEGEDDDWLQITGMNNTYSSGEAIDIDKLLEVTDTQSRDRTYTMDQFSDGKLSFADETVSSWIIRWSGGPPASLEHLDEAKPKEFMLDGSLASGFDFSELPVIPPPPPPADD